MADSFVDEPSTPAALPGFMVGDQVYYVPALDHALERDSNGDYAWELAKTDHQGKTTVLSGEKLEFFLESIRRAPDPREARKQLTFVRPLKTWKATVRTVHEDGTLDLDIVSPKGGVTLHYDRVAYSQLQKTPHSCHIGG